MTTTDKSKIISNVDTGITAYSQIVNLLNLRTTSAENESIQFKFRWYDKKLPNDK